MMLGVPESPALPGAYYAVHLAFLVCGIACALVYVAAECVFPKPTKRPRLGESGTPENPSERGVRVVGVFQGAAEHPCDSRVADNITRYLEHYIAGHPAEFRDDTGLSHPYLVKYTLDGVPYVLGLNFLKRADPPAAQEPARRPCRILYATKATEGDSVDVTSEVEMVHGPGRDFHGSVPGSIGDLSFFFGTHGTITTFDGSYKKHALGQTS